MWSLSQDLCCSFGEDKAGVHHPWTKVHMGEDHQINLGQGRADGVLEGQCVEPISDGAVQVHKLHLLRHVLWSIAKSPRSQRDYKSWQTHWRWHLRHYSHHSLPSTRHWVISLLLGAITKRNIMSIVKQAITHNQSHMHKKRYTKLLRGLKNGMLGCVLYFRLIELL